MFACQCGPPVLSISNAFNMIFMRLRVPHTIESGMIIRFNLAKLLHRVRFSSPPSLAYAFSHTSITYSGISRVSVGSYHRKHIWPRGWGISELKRFIHYLNTFHSQSQVQLSISPIRCYLMKGTLRTDNMTRPSRDVLGTGRSSITPSSDVRQTSSGDTACYEGLHFTAVC